MRSFVLRALRACLPIPLAVLCLPLPRVSATVYVNKNAPGAVHDGTSWETAFTSIQAGINAAAGSSEIWVASSMPAAPAYVENVTLKTGVSLYGGFGGTETDRSQRDWKTNVTVLDGNKTGSVVTVAFLNSTVDGFTIRNGKGTWGGGISAKGTVVIANNTISDNICGASGGGICVTAGTATITGNTISGNRGDGTSWKHGGGIYVTNSSTIVDGNVITGNDGAYGGGVCADAGSVAITGNTISLNTGEQGGGVYLAVGTATVSGNDISRNNRCGIQVDSGVVVIAANRLMGNSAADPGGGIRVNSGAVTISNCVISGAQGSGDGVYVDGGTVAVTNSTITDHAIVAPISCPCGISLGAGSVTVTNCIVAFNRKGIYRETAATVAVDHTDTFGNTLFNYGGLTDPTGTNGNISVDPLFVNRSGGDINLQAASPCIDAGDDSAVSPGGTDLDGHARIRGAHVDMGACEFVPEGQPPFFPSDVRRALALAAGIGPALPEDLARLNVEPGTAIDLLDAVRIARKAAGLE